MSLPLAQLSGPTTLAPRDLQDKVSEAGGVPFYRPVELGFLGRKDLDEYLQEVVDSEYPPARAEADARVLAAFGVLDPGLDLRTLRKRLLEDNIAGFYDERPRHQRLFVVSDERELTTTNRLVLAHELRHALQDQYMNVYDVLPREVGDFDDRRLALLSLLEGDATLLMEQLSGSTLPLSALRLPDAPRILRDQMVLPYSIGLPFARNLWRAGGWEALRAAWCRPPESTEQVLHPEKYRSGERPDTPSVSYRPRGALFVGEGVFGEALARTLLDPAAPATATEGWGGDLYQAWRLGDRTLLLWATRWDLEADAKEFAAALLGSYARAGERAPAKGGWTVFRKGGWRVGFLRDGRDLWLVSSDDRKSADRAMRALTPAGTPGTSSPGPARS